MVATDALITKISPGNVRHESVVMPQGAADPTHGTKGESAHYGGAAAVPGKPDHGPITASAARHLHLFAPGSISTACNSLPLLPSVIFRKRRQPDSPGKRPIERAGSSAARA